MEQWYTLHTKPKAEYQLASVLQRRGIQVYLPELPAAPDTPTKPFFPCYLFSKIDFEQISITQLLWTPGLRRIISFDDQPVPVPAEIIDLIREKLSEVEAAQAAVTCPFQKGDPVKITEGPFRDMVAIFDGSTPSSERVRVLLDILGRASRVQVDRSQLEEVSPATSAQPDKRPRRSRGRGRPIYHNNN